MTKQASLKYTARNGGKATFVYAWSMSPYKKENKGFHFGITVEGDHYTNSCEGLTIADFPELEHVFEKIKVKYDAVATSSTSKGIQPYILQAYFTDADMLWEFVNYVSAVMRTNGIPTNKYLLVSGISSREYITDMMQHYMNTSLTYTDLERHMLSCTRLNIQTYIVSAFDAVLDDTSPIKFSPDRELTPAEILRLEVKGAPRTFANEHVSTCLEALGEPDESIPTTTNLSVLAENKPINNDYNLSIAMWM